MTAEPQRALDNGSPVMHPGVVIAGLRLNAPRFDTGWQALVNVLGIALFLTVIVFVVRNVRQGRRMSVWDWVLLLLHVSVAGIYLPLGPLVWLGLNGREQRKDVSQSSHG